MLQNHFWPHLHRDFDQSPRSHYLHQAQECLLAGTLTPDPKEADVYHSLTELYLALVERDRLH